MPVVSCPECRSEQTVLRELTGLTVRCKKCGEEFKAVEDAVKPVRRQRTVEVAGGEPLTIASMAKSVGLVAGLLLAVALVAGVIILLVRSGKEPAKTEPAKADVTKAEPVRPPAPRPAEEAESSAERAVATARMTVVGAVVLAVFYVVAVLATGAWVAADANARGMPGLGWASFYYLFHLLTRVSIIPLAIIPSMALPVVGGLFVLLFVEPVSWVGLFVYLYARRGGRFARCPNCENRRLNYLVACPICGDRAG